MASTPGPTRSPDAKKIELPKDVACRVLPFAFDFSKPVIVQAVTSPETYCAVQFKPDGIVFKSFQVAKQPKNGMVNLNPQDQRWYYYPKKDFKGEDVFVIDLKGYDKIKWGETQMLVYVKVQ